MLRDCVEIVLRNEDGARSSPLSYVSTTGHMDRGNCSALNWRMQVERNPVHNDMLQRSESLILCENVNYGEGPNAPGSIDQMIKYGWLYSSSDLPTA